MITISWVLLEIFLFEKYFLDLAENQENTSEIVEFR